MYYCFLFVISIVVVLIYDGSRYLLGMTGSEWIIGTLLKDKLPIHKRIFPFLLSVVIVLAVLLFVTFAKGKIIDL